MSNVKLHMLHPEYMGNMYRQGIGFQVEVARKLMGENTCYEQVELGEMSGTLDDIADEVFDLTNNPDRQDEREKRYGNGRSLSVGDIVEADGKKLLCCSFGWKSI